MNLLDIGILIAIGLIGGVWNAIAGGATLFTFPALIAVGLPPVVANATNYLALLPSNAAALPAYRQELRGLGHRLIPLLLVSGLGAVLGSVLLLVSDPDVFTGLIPYLILLATALFAFGEALRTWIHTKIGASRALWGLYAILFLCSIYGGYFGAGLGIILLALAQIMGFSDFNTANSIKNLLATSFTVISICIFGLGGLIAWPQALVMMAGSTMGGYAGGHLAKRVNSRYLRGAVIAFGLILAGVFFMRGLS